jgi:hypothetical protein
VAPLIVCALRRRQRKRTGRLAKLKVAYRNVYSNFAGQRATLLASLASPFRLNELRLKKIAAISGTEEMP